MKVKALKPVRRHKAGEVFEVSKKNGRILVAIGKCEEYHEPLFVQPVKVEPVIEKALQAEAIKSKKPRNSYKTREMKAE